MEIWSRIKEVEFSILVKIILIFSLVEILLYLGFKVWPDIVSPVVAISLTILMIIFTLVAGLGEAGLSFLGIYTDFTEETLKYSKNILVGIAGGLIVSLGQYDIGKITTVADAIGATIAILIRAFVVLVVLIGGLILFILVERNHQELNDKEGS